MAGATIGERPGTLRDALRDVRDQTAGYSGIWSWITTVDHKRIGIMYGVTAFVFFLAG
ncbi:MAG: hypothetical protein IIB19_02605, partial [Chloroflexi bacterium]|nr:hypothetical protein [Chloroflexota bacterium]